MRYKSTIVRQRREEITQAQEKMQVKTSSKGAARSSPCSLLRLVLVTLLHLSSSVHSQQSTAKDDREDNSQHVERINAAIGLLCTGSSASLDLEQVAKCVQPPQEVMQIRAECRESVGLPELKADAKRGLNQVCRMLKNWLKQAEKRANNTSSASDANKRRNKQHPSNSGGKEAPQPKVSAPEDDQVHAQQDAPAGHKQQGEEGVARTSPSSSPPPPPPPAEGKAKTPKKTNAKREKALAMVKCVREKEENAEVKKKIKSHRAAMRSRKGQVKTLLCLEASVKK